MSGTLGFFKWSSLVNFHLIYGIKDLGGLENVSSSSKLLLVVQKSCLCLFYEFLKIINVALTVKDLYKQQETITIIKVITFNTNCQ